MKFSTGLDQNVDHVFGNNFSDILCNTCGLVNSSRLLFIILKWAAATT